MNLNLLMKFDFFFMFFINFNVKMIRGGVIKLKLNIL